MPLLVEKSLASEVAIDILDDAENLAEDKLSVLEHFLASLNLPENALADLGDGALALAASFLAALGIDLDLDTTNTPLKPAGTEQASFHIRRVPKEETECAAAPAAPPEDLSTVLPPSKEIDVDVVYSYGPGVEQEIEEAGAKGAVESEIHETFFPDALSHFEKEFGTVCPVTGGPHDLDAAVIIDKYFDVSVDRPPLASPHFMMSVRIKCNNNCGPGVRMDYQWEIPTIH